MAINELYPNAHSIIFNGVNSLDFNLYVSGDKSFNSAEKDYEKVSIPGRNGDLFLFRNRYKNVKQKYNAIIFGNRMYNYNDLVRQVKEWLLSSNGYCVLEDTYNPDEYRLAQFIGPIDFDTKLLKAAETELEFDCRPERFLKSGKSLLDISNGKVLSNPTLFKSRPMIGLTGKGTLLFKDKDDQIYGAFTVLNNNFEDLFIDCESRICYGINSSGELENANNYVELESINNDFPELSTGDTKITFDNTITSVAIAPKWWTI